MTKCRRNVQKYPKIAKELLRRQKFGLFWDIFRGQKMSTNFFCTNFATRAAIYRSQNTSNKPIFRLFEGVFLEFFCRSPKRPFLSFLRFQAQSKGRDIRAKFPGHPRFLPSKPRKTNFRGRERTLRPPPLRVEDPHPQKVSLSTLFLP